MSDDALYTAAETRELDRIAIEDCGIPGIRLMSRAGRASFELLLAQWSEPGHIHVFCGTGNNGGDGYIVAALAHSRGIPVTVHQLGDSASIVGDAATARNQAVADGVAVQAFSDAVAPASGVVVDALLGTGLSGDVRGAYGTAIDTINNSGLPVLRAAGDDWLWPRHEVLSGPLVGGGLDPCGHVVAHRFWVTSLRAVVARFLRKPRSVITHRHTR